MWSQMSLFVLIAATLKAFTVLPYVQIDFVHYFRLAQCDAKCAEKYGKPVKRRLNDGTFIEYYGNDGEEYKLCIAGCNRRRTISRRENNGSENALISGMQFWMDTNAFAGRSDNSPIKSVRLGCMDMVESLERNDFEDTIEGLVFVDENDSEHQQAIRYIVQWKQRTYDGSLTEENGWITASIESEPVFKVEGMVPSMQYRFMVTAVGSGGRLGGPVMSDWAQSLSNDKKLHLPAGPVFISTHYNSDYGVCALIKWHHQPNPSTDDLFINCHYSITVSNETFQQTILFTVDRGNGILLSNLQFSSEYSVALRTISSKDSIVEAVTKHQNVPQADESKAAVERKFVTPACNEIFGSGSFECAPEPVKELEAVVEPNGTTWIHWIPSSEPNAILVYQLIYQPVTNHRECGSFSQNNYVNASATAARIQLTGRVHCEYLIKLINYDLIGREAQAEISVWYRPNSPSLSINLLLYVSPILVIIFLLILKCFACLCCVRSKKAYDQNDTVTIL